MDTKVRRAGGRPARSLVTGITAVLALIGALLTDNALPAHAAGESVNVWLTTTDDSGGRNVTRGLQQQTPIAFAPAAAAASQTITVNENTTLPAVHRRAAPRSPTPPPGC